MINTPPKLQSGYCGSCGQARPRLVTAIGENEFVGAFCPACGGVIAPVRMIKSLPSAEEIVNTQTRPAHTEGTR